MLNTPITHVTRIGRLETGCIECQEAKVIDWALLQIEVQKRFLPIQPLACA